jgi:hypothetical protein
VNPVRVRGRALLRDVEHEHAPAGRAGDVPDVVVRDDLFGIDLAPIGFTRVDLHGTKKRPSRPHDRPVDNSTQIAPGR